MTVRSVGLFGGGQDPVNKVLGLKSPAAAAADPPRGGSAADSGNPQPGHHLGQQPADPRRRRGRGGRLLPRPGARRTGRGRQQPDSARADRLLGGRPRTAVGICSHARRRRSRRGRQGAVHRAHAQGRGHLPALKDVKAKVAELNDPASGRLLPGVQIEPYYDRIDLLKHHHRDRDGEPVPRHRCWSSRSCSCS